MSSSHASSLRQSEPLLPPKSLKEPVEPLSPPASTAIKVLSVVRIAVGAAFTIAPRFSFALSQFPIPAAYAFMPRLFGIRDLALGELLLTAEDKNSPDGGRREIKRTLWAGIGCDLVDVAAVAYGVANGTLPKPPALIIGGGAIAFIAMATIGMRGLEKEKARA
ncbi:uncharacterized protein EI97DRAFT_434938 [Westerdykella ornata]|uniref:Uncharacterized protein n=1 Tax=Westerdykella ornata TaxID=318751 RepID=A0A6A6JFD7_WESOR|nr:uncharacterized protein EI97DRAFT_434938 [Westerdykella ornata]KAF2274708.1 hypothetical protein EI97DRAFT_434938 [Westerdykella ornata]